MPATPDDPSWSSDPEVNPAADPYGVRIGPDDGTGGGMHFNGTRE